MKKWHLFAGLLAIGATLTLPAGEAEAARRTSLAGNRLILDRTDILTFPQLSVDYANMLSLDYGPTQGAGSGLAILGNDRMAFGLGVARGDIFQREIFPEQLGHPNLGGVPSLVGAYPAPFTVVDLFFGTDLGVGLLGARLALGNNGNYLLPDDRNLDEDSIGQTFLRADVGYTLTGALRLDTALHILYSGGSEIGNGDLVSEGSFFRLGLTGRGYLGLAPGIDLGFLGDLAYESTEFVTIPPRGSGGRDDVDDEGRFTLVAGAGPVYTIEGVTTLAGYAVLGLRTRSGDPSSETDFDEFSGLQFIVPGVHLAADIHLTDWLYFRTGMQYFFAYNRNTQDSSDVEEITSSRSSDFGWRAGLGLNLGNFTFDGTFSQGFLTAGPNFIGGQNPGLFTMLSATYNF